MRQKSSLSSLLSVSFAGFLLAGAAAPALAQSAPDCPSLPQDASDLRWEVLRTDSALLCRAMHRDSGQEAFAVTLARRSPFRPASELRAEQGEIQGERFWWYRAEIAGRPNELVRETLLKVGRDQVAHVFIRTDDKDSLGHLQGVVQGLSFDPQGLANR